MVEVLCGLFMAAVTLVILALSGAKQMCGVGHNPPSGLDPTTMNFPRSIRTEALDNLSVSYERAD